MPRKAKPLNLRTGLKWRDGRPRWEPSPANRRVGIRGVDLKDGGRWLSMGEAVDVCEARTQAATILRDAIGGCPQAIAMLRKVVRGLAPAATDGQRLRRQFTADLFERAAAVAAGGEDPHTAPRTSGGPRTGAALVDAYFADDKQLAKLSASSIRVYAGHTWAKTRAGPKGGQCPRFVAKWGDTPVAEISHGQMKDWYEDLCEETSVAVAHLQLGFAGSLFRYALDKDWTAALPTQKLRLVKPKGRRAFFTPEDEAAFVPFCDTHGFEDVADAFTAGVWTGARPTDLCLANLRDLAGDVWRFTPHKTMKREREAMPGLLEPVSARVRRPRTITPLDGAFLVDREGKRHTAATLGARFALARSAAVAAEVVRPGFLDMMLKDTRKTCVTRLFLADVEPTRIFQWTGHSPDEAAEILREHYIVLSEEGSRAMAAKLETWAKAGGMSW